ncbi:WYL domain-containing protein [Actinocrispum sp. NPDC049592]|uniref:helix-turn-helix transcriptional regulator n=1 Tax=Actinocrispum sp. NPDC049592 TaxID=3154835 RepID=UPI003411FF13
MNRTDRLYAIVEDLRAVAPRRRTARSLADRYEVSVRTIERDISALQQAGVPVYADAGRKGGYALDRAMTLPPLNFTAAEAVAVSVALQHASGSPFAREARTALQKMVAAMAPHDATAARELAERVRFMAVKDAEPPASIPAIIEEAVAGKQVLRLDYIDKSGVPTAREVEPEMFLAGMNGWYLVGWCRLRSALRAFRLDRIVTVQATGCVAARRDYIAGDLPGCVTHVTTLG